MRCNECPLKKEIENNYLKIILKILKRKYKTIKFFVKYDKEDDFYYIIHNSKSLDFNKRFNSFIDPIVFKFHKKKKFKNFCISFDYDYFKKFKNRA